MTPQYQSSESLCVTSRKTIFDQHLRFWTVRLDITWEIYLSVSSSALTINSAFPGQPRRWHCRRHCSDTAAWSAPDAVLPAPPKSSESTPRELCQCTVEAAPSQMTQDGKRPEICLSPFSSDSPVSRARRRDRDSTSTRGRHESSGSVKARFEAVCVCGSCEPRRARGSRAGGGITIICVVGLTDLTAGQWGFVLEFRLFYGPNPVAAPSDPPLDPEVVPLVREL